jgi:hypothetical protein
MQQAKAVSIKTACSPQIVDKPGFSDFAENVELAPYCTDCKQLIAAWTGPRSFPAEVQPGATARYRD